jgi:hypothetical protein
MNDRVQITFRRMPHDEDVADLVRCEAARLMREHDQITWIHVNVTRQREGYEVKVIVLVPGHTLVERHYPDLNGSIDPLASVARAFESAADMLVYHEERQTICSQGLEPVVLGHGIH